jgi:3-phosphoshikimate 1-carboxyvinyltransferase
MLLQPAKRLRGTISVPGDKSISHRAALIAALADGTSQISNFSISQDCAATLSCLAQLGISIDRDPANTVRIRGVGIGGMRAAFQPLDCGNSGTTMRLLAGILAGQTFESNLTGDGSLRSRPMRRVIEPLTKMGAQVSSDNGHAPLAIRGMRPLRSIKYGLTVPSAQVKSCVLLAALHANGLSEVVETAGQTRDHTERMLEWFGAPIQISKRADGARTCAVTGVAQFNSCDVRVPGDFSSAAFLMAAATLLPESDLQINGVGLNPTRAEFLTTLSANGAKVDIADLVEDSNEPAGSIHIRGVERLEPAQHGRSNVISGPRVAALIDELPMLAVIGTQVVGGLVIRDAGELRHKESDRIATTVKNLRAMGAEVEDYEDGLAVAGPTGLRGGLLTSAGDHRIAMAFSVAALIADGQSQMDDAACVTVSFPGFFDLLDSIAER